MVLIVLFFLLGCFWVLVFWFVVAVLLFDFGFGCL